MRVLALVAAGPTLPPRETLRLMEREDAYPRVTLFEDTLQCDMLDERFLARAPGWRRALYRRMPVFLAQAIEAYAVRRRYDIVVSWSERLTLAYAALLTLTFTRSPPHLALMYWISPPKKARILRFVHGHIDRILIWSESQRNFAVQRLGISPSRITLIPYQVDQRFWRPMDMPCDCIASVGNEMRDYPTLINAMRGLDIPCEIVVAKRALVPGVQAMLDQGLVPPGVRIQQTSYTDLRAIYARSRFIVIPLQPSDTNHGLTVILEAMAMGKPVICSRVAGHIDVIQEGVTGLFVEQGNPDALREMIAWLWNNPHEAERMGAAARRTIEERHTFDGFVANVQAAAEQTVAERRAPRVSHAHV